MAEFWTESVRAAETALGDAPSWAVGLGAVALGWALGLLLGRAWERRASATALAEARRRLGAAEAERDAAVGEALALKLKSEGVEQRLDLYVQRLGAAVSGAALDRPRPRFVEPPWERLGESRIPILAVGNLKGGVGKTTLAGDLGARFADQDEAAGGAKARVLFIDLDFQGSLSQTMTAIAGAPNANRAPRLFAEDAEPAALVAEFGDFEHRRLRGSAYVDCDSASAAIEERLFFEWAISEAPHRDLRLALAELLYAPAVQERFDLVVMDLPPRNTVFAYAAYMAATDLVAPIRPDPLSVETAARFLEMLERGRSMLWPRLHFAGFVANLTEGASLSPVEAEAAGSALEVAARAWSGPGEGGLVGAAPRMVAIAEASGRRFAAFEDGGGAQAVYARLADSLAARLSRPIGGGEF